MITARAVRIREPGDVSVLEVGPFEVREPGPGELLVEVTAAGLNRADLLQRRGLYPAPAGVAADVPGLEYSGQVAAVGLGVNSFRPGERVMGIVGGGAMATHLVVSEREVMPLPPTVSETDAAAIPEAFLTSWDALFRQANLAAGEHVLIHAVASGVGTAALQLALVAGAEPLGTSRTREKLERCTALGLAHALCCPEPKFAAEVLALTHGRGADVILDTVGAPYFEENLRALAPRGRMVLIGTMGGANATAPLGLWLQKRATIIGSVLRSRAPEEKATLARDFAHRMVPLFERGRLKPIVDAVLPMSDVREAHRRMERGDTFGKIVLAW